MVKRGSAGRDLHLDVDGASLDALERDGGDAREHDPWRHYATLWRARTSASTLGEAPIGWRGRCVGAEAWQPAGLQAQAIHAPRQRNARELRSAKLVG